MKRLLSLVSSMILLAWICLPAVIVQASSPNLMANPSVETASGGNPANWTANSWGTNTASTSYANTGHTGSHSLLASMSAQTSGDVKWIPDAVSVTPNQSYTYSDYYLSTVATELDAQYTDTLGNVSYIYLANVPATSAWAPINVTFNTPANAAKVSVLHILAANGSLQTDDFSLSVTVPVTVPPNSDGNLISNPSFETANGNSPANWQPGSWGTNTTIFSYVTNDGHTGTHSAKIQTTSYTSGDAKWFFNPVAVQPGTQYTYSDYYKSTIASSIVAQYDNGSGGLSYQFLSTPVVSATAWQGTSVSFTVPTTAKNVTIFHLISGVGSLQIDDSSLVPPVASTTPTVSITSPITNSVVSGNVVVTANAVANAGIANVQFKLDGNNLGSAVTIAPFQQSWNTTTASNGVHNLTAVLTSNDNKVTTSTAVTVTVDNAASNGNLVLNPSMEIANPTNTKLPLNWNSTSWGTNTSKFTYLTTGHTGSRSVKTQITSYTSGSAYWYFDSQPVVSGQTYDYSDYYESNVINEIDATFTMSDGSVQYLYLGDPSPSPNSWTKFRTQFTAPVGAVSVTMAHNIYSVGWLTTDDYSLTPFSYQGFNRPIISITDDDGYSSFYNNGLPLLQKYGFRSTDYIITGYVDNVDGYMTSAMVKSLYTSGQEIGSHTITHPDLTTLTATNMDNELRNSQTFLQTLLGVPVTDFAAPYGSMNQQVVTDAKKYYQTYRGVQAGYNAKNNLDRYNLMVQNLVSTTTLAEVQSWIAKAQATNTWLILVYHQVDPSTASGDYNTYPSDFDAQLATIKASGVTVETVAQALKEVNSQP